jgi:biotin/methionine sulfoxide reductase
VEIPGRVADEAFLGEFRADPDKSALRTPSGRIELFSATIDSFGYEDCPGHPVWRPGPTVSGDRDAWPFTLVANQPSGRLHSQQDMGAHSMGQKVQGRAPLRMHPADARDRGLAEGSVVRVSSPWGSCLAGLELSDAVRPGVVQLSTGAWYDPSAPGVTCAHGNPNALTEDAGTSALSQGCTGQLTRVAVEPFTGTLPPVRAFTPPPGIAPA